GVQIHGGMGFVEETGAAQFLRDARILPIYEGTNGIQAIDLVSRKLPLGNGEVVRSFINEMRQTAQEARSSNDELRTRIGTALDEALDTLDKATEDRKSTRLNSSHVKISYAVFCLKKKMIDSSKVI